ncbi:hypothetical protein HD806DRAFT_514296 [Xylariaceae sp. AK1471]|nr:hypothetical protein HD806DRAFT_514296 [Xylariaceae sp. AK1471]
MCLGEGDSFISTPDITPQVPSDSPPKESYPQRTIAQTQLWCPLWLRRTTLIAFALLFTLLWISLVILWKYDVKNNGIPITLSSSHYSWKYGPTAILTIVVSLWRQVDYHTKLLQPWGAMKSRATSSSQSLLLDYISPINAKCFFKAAKNRHSAVALSVLIFSLLKTVILLSTGLIQSEPTLLSRQHPITINNKFDGSSFWEMYDNKSTLHDGWGWDDHGAREFLWNWTDKPAFALQSLLQGRIEYPQGTQARTAFQTFDLPTNWLNATTVSATVEIFIPDITCETPSEIILEVPIYWNSTISFPVNTKACSTNANILFNQDQTGGYTSHYFYLHLNCSEVHNPANLSRRDQRLLGNDTQPDRRLGFLVANATYPTTGNGNFGDPTSVKRLTATICQLDYHIEHGKLTRDRATSVSQLEISGVSSLGSHIYGLTGPTFAEIALGVTQYSERSPNSRLGIFNLMNSSLKDPRENGESFFDPDTLRIAAREVLEGLFVQITHELFVLPDNTTSEGTITYYENRLRLQTAFLWPMITSLVIISALVAAFLPTSPSAVVSHDPGLIGTTAAILSSSQVVCNLLRPVGTMRTSNMEKWLDGQFFKTSVSHSGEFSIMATGKSPTILKEPGQRYPMLNSRLSRQDIKEKSGKWIPFNFTYPFLSLLFLLPLLAIGTLEVLYRMSDKNQGLADANDNIFQYISLYASGGVVLTIATAFNSFDFTVASFSPYYALSLGRGIADSNILVNFLEYTPLISLYRTLKKRHAAASLSSIASLIGSTLTIVVSGLWITSQSVSISTHVETKQITTWDFKWTNSATNDGGAAELLVDILQDLSTAPDGVWEDLVFPEWNNSGLLLDTSGRDATESVTFSLPALRPELKCDPIPQTAVNLTASPNTGFASISAELGIPGNCPWRDGDDATSILFYWWTGGGPSHSEWYGQVYDFPAVPWNGSQGGADYNLSATLSSGPSQASVLASTLDGCPSLGIFHVLRDVGYIGNATFLQCSQKIQRVQTSVVLKSERPGMVKVADLLSTPIPDEDTATYLTNSVDNYTSFQYRIDAQLSVNLSTSPEFENYHPFFSLITTGNFTEVFLNSENLDAYKAALNKAYKSYMVHVINSPIFRKNATDSSNKDLPVITGTIHRKVARLSIDYKSKLILQIMLATMLVLEACAVWQMNLRGTLPRKPFSIASIMGFLAGSNICKPGFLPKGAEWMDKEELARLFGDQIFGLGWWDDTSQNTRNEEHEDTKNLRFGIDVGEPRYRGFKAGLESKRTEYISEPMATRGA